MIKLLMITIGSCKFMMFYLFFAGFFIDYRSRVTSRTLSLFTAVRVTMKVLTWEAMMLIRGCLGYIIVILYIGTIRGHHYQFRRPP